MLKSLPLHSLRLALLPALLLFPALAVADPGNQYCITPPFITAGVKPNLLLLIDNSASMYDLAYTDQTTHNYCANNPSTTCSTVGAACSGAAICKITATTSSTSTTSPLACTASTDCDAATGTCPSGATCTWVAGDTCNTARGQCKKSTSTVTVTTTTPKACTTDADCTASGDSCNNRCRTTTTPCLDTTYSNTGTYTGYFKQTGTYCYSTKSNKTTCVYSGSYDEFDGNAIMPATCDYGGSASATPFVCVNVDATSGKVNNFVATGRFLNWLSMSKFDIEKGILTGGKYRTDFGGDLVGESRGCAGRKFIKSVPGLSGISFGIRGGSAAVGTTSQATQYGQTFIEIYKGDYNVSSCTAALNDWKDVTNTNLGPLQVDTKSCIGGTGGISDVLAAANQTVHDCFWYFNGHGLSNLQPIENTCANIYKTKSPSDIIDPTAPDAICSNALSHAASLVDGNTTGFLGQCFTGGAWNDSCALTENKDFCQGMGGSGAVTDPASESVVAETVQNVPGFVMELGLASLEMMNDYTTLSPAPAYATKGFPLAVYDPWGVSPWPPEGLVQKHKDNIRFGVMTFQNNGSGAECNTQGSCSATSSTPGASCTSDSACSGGSCIFSVPCVKTCSVTKTRQCYKDSDCPSGETCGALAKADGGKIVAYVGAGYCSVSTTTACTVDSDCASLTPSGQYCNPSIGTHNAGLLRSIDDIEATSWTPFAEAFYNAMGYFARTNAYTVSSTTAPTSRSDANLSTLPSPNTATSYNASKNPSQFRCQSNNVLLVTDGMSTADKSTAPEALATLYASQVPYIIGGTTYKPGDAGYDASKNHGYDSTNRCPSFMGSRSVANLAWVAKNRDIKTLSTTTASTAAPASASESITTYVVYSGPQTSSDPGLCNPKALMENTAANGGSELYAATNASELYDKLNNALSSVAARAASGTAASILSNSEGSGANILQAVFYPKKIFENLTAADWIGEMQNLWYYVDPYIQNSTIREDTDGDFKLNLLNDYVTRFAFDTASDKTMVQRYQDTDGDGIGDTAIGGLIDPDYVKSLWRAGKLLWQRNITTSPRKLLTSTDGSSLMNFASTTFPGGAVASTATTLAPYLNLTALEAPTLINWFHGQDQAGYRKRTVSIKDPVTGTISSGVWRLGDIISSTPRVQSTVRLNTYNLPQPGGYSDNSYFSFVNSNQYQDRGMVYVGGNDGMLHAFNLGILSVKSVGFEKATLSGSNLGKEIWAYIPKNSLPYLKYQTDPAYSHLYFIDGRTSIFDASIGYTGVGTCVRSTYDTCTKLRSSSVVDSSNNLDPAKNTWRTVVIGGMGLGGASTMSCTAGDSCVQTPIADPADGTKGLGYSSYFAFDVTDPVNPSLLWEFNDPGLGYSLSGPAVVRVGDREKNGKWYAVFGSGPTGPIDTGSHQFLGRSNQNLKFFIVDLQTGTLVKTIDTGIANAFAGSMLGGAIDVDRASSTSSGNYQDDAVYVGFVQKDDSTGTWTKGGIGRIMTKESLDPSDATNPWSWSAILDDIGPVTTAVTRLQDKKNRNLWLFFGTGRYYYRDSVSLDDYNGIRTLYGVKEPCYNTTLVPGNFLDKSCSAAASEGTLVDQTSSISDVTAGNAGWFINLDAATSSEAAERVVTDTVALTNGAVFFTSFKPTMDICGYGGNSFLWGVKYDTGGQASSSSLTGKALIQLSTGEFREVDLAEAFTDKLNRRMMTPMTGKPPTDAPPIVSNSMNKPVKKILHIQEH